MDDRFDFILTSKNIRDGDKSVKYIPDTYWAIGQDGERFNKSLTSLPTNTSVPFDVLTALYGNSDHLPVTLDLEIDKISGTGLLNKLESATLNFPNPLAGNSIRMDLQTDYSTVLEIELIDQMGRVVDSANWEVGQGRNTFEFNIGNQEKGLYLIRLTDAENNSIVRKLVVN